LRSSVSRFTKAETPSPGSGRAERKSSLPSVTTTRTSGETTTVFSRARGPAAPVSSAASRSAAPPRPRRTLRRGRTRRRWRVRGEIDLTLDGPGRGEERLLAEPRRHDLKAERQAVRREPRGDRDRRKSRERGRDGEDVGEIHLERIVHLLSEAKRRRGNRGTD